MDALNRNRKYALIFICASKKLLSKCNVLPPYTCDSDEESENNYKRIKRAKPLRIRNYIENIAGMKAKQFQSHFRINRRTYDQLLPIVHNAIKKQTIIGRKKMDTEKQLLATLWILATPDSYRSVGERFDMGKSSLSAAFFRIVKVLNKISKYVIKWPIHDEIESICREFYNIAGVDNVIGAIDGSFIPIKAPKVNADVYVIRKCNHAITLQATSISSLRFTDCYVGYPGSVSDTRIFRNSDLYDECNRNEHFYFPNDTFIVGDKAYPLLNWCIPLYIDRGNMNAAKRNFNLKMSQTRQVIERSFALLFGRFRRLKFLDMNRVDFIPATVLACCVLHNLCLNNNDVFIDEYIQDGRQYVQGNDGIDDEYFQPRNIDDVVREGNAKRENLCRSLFEVAD